MSKIQLTYKYKIQIKIIAQTNINSVQRKERRQIEKHA